MQHAPPTQAVSGLRPTRRGTVGLWFALIGVAVAIAVIVALLVTWPNHDGNSARAHGPTPAVIKLGSKASADTERSAAAKR